MLNQYNWLVSGIIEEKEDSNLKISFMTNSGGDKFSWPTPPDCQVVGSSTILCKIREPPYPVSSRHFKLKPEVLQFVNDTFNNFDN